jgi:hemolysin D
MNALSARPPSTLEREAEQTIVDFQGETAEIIGHTDSLAVRGTVWLFSIMLIAFIVLTCTVHLDRVVMAPGRIISQSPTIVVQPLEISIVRSLNVRPGQLVKKDQVLATLDPTFSAADVAQLERTVARLSAEIARLRAESNRTPFEPPADATAEYQLQQAIWRHRQAEHTAKLANFDQRLATLNATIQRSQDEAAHYRSRLKILSEIETMRRTLEKNQTGSRLNSLVATDTKVEVLRSLGNSESTIISSKHDMEAQRAERDVYIQQWRSTILTDLSARQDDLGRAREELSKAQKRRDLVELRAVEDAVVLEAGHYSVGSVVEPAKPIYSLMPINGTLEVEAEIAGMDQGFVKVGDPVQVKFEAYRYVEHGMAKGEVRTISNDSFAHTEGSASSASLYYRARIKLTEVALRNVPSDFQLVPGMPLSADIVVGQRSIMSYLVEGALKSGSEGMREP